MEIFKSISIKIILNVSLILFGLNQLKSQDINHALISVLNAGDCKNLIFHENRIDSICISKGINHYYYIHGIELNELDSYSKKILGIQLKKSKCLSSNQADKIGISSHYNYSSFYLLVDNNRIIKTISYFNFNPDKLDNLFLYSNQLNSNKKLNFSRDSFTLNYTNKIKVDSNIRLNPKCRLRGDSKNCYLLEPLFNNKLYKLSNNTGKIERIFDFTKLKISFDSIINLIYGKQNKINSEIYDLLTSSNSRSIFESTLFTPTDLNLHSNKIYVLMNKEVPTLDENNQILSLNHRLVLSLDTNLQIINFYLDRHLNYNNKTPVTNYLINFNPKAFSLPLIYETDEYSKKLIEYQFSLIEPHEIKPFKKDSIDYPDKLNCIVRSNLLGYYSNLGNIEKPVWILKNYSIIALPTSNQYFSLRNGQNLNLDSTFDCKPYFSQISDIKTIGKNIFISYAIGSFQYKCIFDLEIEKVIEITALGKLYEADIISSFDESGGLLFFPGNNQPEQKFIYLER